MRKIESIDKIYSFKIGEDFYISYSNKIKKTFISLKTEENKRVLRANFLRPYVYVSGNYLAFYRDTLETFLKKNNINDEIIEIKKWSKIEILEDGIQPYFNKNEFHFIDVKSKEAAEFIISWHDEWNDIVKNGVLLDVTGGYDTRVHVGLFSKQDKVFYNNRMFKYAKGSERIVNSYGGKSVLTEDKRHDIQVGLGVNGFDGLGRVIAEICGFKELDDNVDKKSLKNIRGELVTQLFSKTDSFCKDTYEEFNKQSALISTHFKNKYYPLWEMLKINFGDTPKLMHTILYLLYLPKTIFLFPFVSFGSKTYRNNDLPFKEAIEIIDGWEKQGVDLSKTSYEENKKYIIKSGIYVA